MSSEVFIASLGDITESTRNIVLNMPTTQMLTFEDLLQNCRYNYAHPAKSIRRCTWMKHVSLTFVLNVTYVFKTFVMESVEMSLI